MTDVVKLYEDMRDELDVFVVSLQNIRGGITEKLEKLAELEKPKVAKEPLLIEAWQAWRMPLQGNTLIDILRVSEEKVWWRHKYDSVINFTDISYFEELASEGKLILQPVAKTPQLNETWR